MEKSTSKYVRMFENMGVEELPADSVSSKVRGSSRQHKAEKIVKKHTKHFKEATGKTYNEMPVPIIYTEGKLINIFKVYGESSKTYYDVRMTDEKWQCSCYDFQYRGNDGDCKHIMAVKSCIENDIPMLDKEYIMKQLENIEE
tara:strand:- start:3207 stop:3635 length:429 start_codon:yes stop_codon:yes gene_type:complete